MKAFKSLASDFCENHHRSIVCCAGLEESHQEQVNEGSV